eukprot:10949319-Alexandrium_andersonii.AAC.1
MQPLEPGRPCARATWCPCAPATPAHEMRGWRWRRPLCAKLFEEETRPCRPSGPRPCRPALCGAA